MMLRPCAFRSRTMRNSFSTSADRKRRGRLVHDDQPRLHRQRAGDLHHLLLGDGEIADARACGFEVEPEPVGDGPGVGGHLAPVHEGSCARLAADEDVLGDRHVRRERELLVDRDDAEPLRVVRRGEGRPAWPSSEIEPASGCCAPDRIFSSVDLPAPFSPSSAWISPGATSKPHIVERLHAGEALADPRHARGTARSCLIFERRTARRGRPADGEGESDPGRRTCSSGGLIAYRRFAARRLVTSLR